MWIVSARLIWVPLYLFMLVLLGFKERRKLLVLLPLLIITVILCDQISVHCFKNVFERLRPCHEPSLEGLVHIVNSKCGGKYGFVSSHAANTFGIAIISLLVIKEKWFSITLITWASLVSYSRVYLGVHYPGDIVVGALLGTICGYLIFLIYKYISTKCLDKSTFFMPRKS